MRYTARQTLLSPPTNCLSTRRCVDRRPSLNSADSVRSRLRRNPRSMGDASNCFPSCQLIPRFSPAATESPRVCRRGRSDKPAAEAWRRPPANRRRRGACQALSEDGGGKIGPETAERRTTERRTTERRTARADGGAVGGVAQGMGGEADGRRSFPGRVGRGPAGAMLPLRAKETGRTRGSGPRRRRRRGAGGRGRGARGRRRTAAGPSTAW
jgi:hypothetical protein